VHTLAQSVFGYVRKHDLLRAGDRVGVAVSGGADSVALLRALLQLRQDLGIVVSVVHLNHKLRGPESEADQEFVCELAAAHGLEFVCESRDDKAYAAEQKLSLEAAARELRQTAFAAWIRGGLDKVATAHTLDDQAETVLMRAIRGSGYRGLQGIHFKIDVQGARNKEAVCGAIVRPFLGVRRSAARDYVGEIGQSWREDSSNQDERFTRNRVRRLIMPVLEREFNPAVAESLAELAEIARGEEEFWTQECAALMDQIGVRRAPACIGLDLARFRNLPLGVQRRLVRSLEMPLEFKHIDDIIKLAGEASTEAKAIQLPEGWKAVCTAHELQFLTAELRTEGRAPVGYQYKLCVPGAVKVWEAGVVVEASLVSSNAEPGYGSLELVDPKLLQHELIVRNWYAGERFWPSHTKEPKKIKELLQDRHITANEKKRWPVVASGDEIVWVRRLGVRQDLQAKNGSGVVIREMPFAREET
jgi:tRNA(Ile)-lysidine synthase